MEDIIRIAIQKSGRLSEDSLKLIKECGVKFNNGKGKLKSVALNFPVEFLFLRDDDIPGYVADGIADVGIVGQNVVLEKEEDVKTVKNLGFSRCRLSLAIPKSVEYNGPEYFNNKSIATSYPKILANYLKENNLKAEIHEISGSVEIAPSIGLAECIFDIVSSGSTLLSNGLKEVEVAVKSEAVLIRHHNISESKNNILKKLLFRMDSVLSANNNNYILLNAPNEAIQKITDLLPGMRSPTVLPLAMEGWSSIHSVISEDEFWQVIENLREAGAEGILVIPIEKMIL